MQVLQPAVIVLARHHNIFQEEVIVMNQLNSIIVEGNLVRDAVLSEPAAGFKVCHFTIGVNRYYKNKNDEGVEEVSYFDVEAYGKCAEYCESKGKKGRGVRVVGRLKQDTWKDDNDKMKSKIYVVAEHIEYKPVFTKNKDDQKEVTPSAVPAKTSDTPSQAAPTAEAAVAASEEVTF